MQDGYSTSLSVMMKQNTVQGTTKLSLCYSVVIAEYFLIVTHCYKLESGEI